MPEIGEIKRGQYIGKRMSQKYIWLACLECGKPRWVYFDKKREPAKRCRRCVAMTPSTREAHAKMQSQRIGIKNHMWKGGKIVSSRGYQQIKLMSGDFFCPTANHNRYVLIHRLVMAKHLGRNLHRWEIVHHQNHDKTDNRLENLQLVTDDRHNQISILEKRISYLENILHRHDIKFNGRRKATHNISP